MTNIEYARWTLNVDIDATRNAYAAMHSGGAKKCSCDPCKNFAVQKEIIYPPTMRKFFEQIGIDYCNEIEAAHTAKMPSGKHLYIGWFYFVGQIISEVKPTDNEESANSVYQRINDEFTFKIGPRTAYCVDAFKGYNVLQIDYGIELPWVIDAAEPK